MAVRKCGWTSQRPIFRRRSHASRGAGSVTSLLQPQYNLACPAPSAFQHTVELTGSKMIDENLPSKLVLHVVLLPVPVSPPANDVIPTTSAPLHSQMTSADSAR